MVPTKVCGSSRLNNICKKRKKFEKSIEIGLLETKNQTNGVDWPEVWITRENRPTKAQGKA